MRNFEILHLAPNFRNRIQFRIEFQKKKKWKKNIMTIIIKIIKYIASIEFLNNNLLCYYKYLNY